VAKISSLQWFSPGPTVFVLIGAEITEAIEEHYGEILNLTGEFGTMREKRVLGSCKIESRRSHEEQLMD
jgi:hypothetical protein